MRAQPFTEELYLLTNAGDNGLTRAKGDIIRPDGSRSPAEIVEGNAKLLN